MAKKGYTPGQIINKLEKAEILLDQGATIAVVSKKIGVSDHTCYRWRKEYGGMRVDQARQLKVSKKQPKRGRLWLNDGSCIRLRPEHKDHVWSYDFMVERTGNGRSFRILNIIDEFSREFLSIKVDRKIRSQDVIDKLFILFIFRGIPEHIRSDLTHWLNILRYSYFVISQRYCW